MAASGGHWSKGNFKPAAGTVAKAKGMAAAKNMAAAVPKKTSGFTPKQLNPAEFAIDETWFAAAAKKTAAEKASATDVNLAYKANPYAGLKVRLEQSEFTGSYYLRHATLNDIVATAKYPGRLLAFAKASGLNVVAPTKQKPAAKAKDVPLQTRYAGVTITTNKYQATTGGKQPKGKGLWAFQIGNRIEAFGGTYTYAKQQAVKVAKKYKVTSIDLLG